MNRYPTDSEPPPPQRLPEPPPGRRARLLARARSALRRVLPFAGGMLAALLGLLLYNSLFPAPAPMTRDELDEAVLQVMASATPPPAYSAQVYQAIQPSLVLIETGGEHKDQKRLGSGVVVTDSGEILTSLHVVDGVDEIKLIFADGTETQAEVAVAQPENDIAVLAPAELPGLLVPAMIGNPDAMRVGDEAFAVGNPFGLYSSMSAGVISGFERTFQPPDSEYELSGLMQIDAAVNPGNSGGPLLNRAGQVVGIVVGIVNPTDQDVFIGIGFAVPIQVAAAGAGLPPY